MKRIGKIKITLEPWHFDDKSSELRIAVTDGYNVNTVTRIFDVSDMESRFDYMFDEAREALRAEIEKNVAKEGT